MSAINKNDYLRLCEASAKTNTPNDQPAITQMNDFMVFLSKLPSKENLKDINLQNYEELLALAQKEIEFGENPSFV